MFIYIALYVAIVFSGIASYYRLVKFDEKIVFGILSVFMVLIASLRFETGPDWEFYNRIYLAANRSLIFHSNEAEPAFQLLFLFFKKTNLGFSALIFSVAVVSVLLKTTFIARYSSIPLLSLIVFLSNFLIGEMGQIRQFLAIGICLWSVHYVLTQKPIRFLVLVFLAGTIHYSSLFFLVVYPLQFLKINWKVITISLSVVLLISLTSWFGILPYLVGFMPGYVQHKFAAYYTPDHFFYLQNTIYFRLLIFVVAMFYLNRKDYFVNFNINVYFFGILFYLLFIPIYNVSARGSVYFKFFEILLIPQIMLELNKAKRIQLVFFVLVLLAYTRHYVLTFIEHGDLFLPYKSMLSIHF